jgi:hypothetical protein
LGGATLKNLKGEHPVNEKSDIAALARLIRYSEEEAQRLGVAGGVIECLRMASVALTSAITNGGAGMSATKTEAARIN